MVRALLFVMVLASCASSRGAGPGSPGVRESTFAEMTAPKKAAWPNPDFFQECSTLADVPDAPSPTWESLVLATDVQTWSSKACEPLERALTPLAESSSLSRQALRDECDEKSSSLPTAVRASCRAVCAARRWLDGRAFARQQATAALEWFRDDFDSAFERIEECLGHARHANQLSDATMRGVFACAKKGPLPKEMTLLFQYVTESVSWRENGGVVSSARPVEAQWLQAADPDPNLPWRAMVTRCRKGNELQRVFVRY